MGQLRECFSSDFRREELIRVVELYGDLTADYGSVVATETETVVHCDAHRHLTRVIWSVIQVAAWIGSV